MNCFNFFAQSLPFFSFILCCSERIFSSKTTSGKVYLARIGANYNPSKPVDVRPLKKAPMKYPSTNGFLTKKGRRSILVLPKRELKKLARRGGNMSINGFSSSNKSNVPSPLFSTCWQFHTMNAQTLAAIGLQLRILYSCLRWNYMNGNRQWTMTKRVIVTRNGGPLSPPQICWLLRTHGQFSEKTDYLRFTSFIPHECINSHRNDGNYSQWLKFSTENHFKMFATSTTFHSTIRYNGKKFKEGVDVEHEKDRILSKSKLEWLNQEAPSLWQMKISIVKEWVLKCQLRMLNVRMLQAICFREPFISTTIKKNRNKNSIQK